VGFEDLKTLVDTYTAERVLEGSPRGTVAVSRGVSMARSRAMAMSQARETAESSYQMYHTWEMQEETMVRIHISSDSEISDWAVVGSDEECLEQFTSLQANVGIDFVGVTFLNLPKELAGRKEYLREFAEKIIQPMRKSLTS
jgi:alkanesulfonate monooxygenase SsuD/methylene tetrahydromethanopterin reductase-like flavin-dependent oxidoreductase (luciferase family)